MTIPKYELSQYSELLDDLVGLKKAEIRQKNKIARTERNLGAVTFMNKKIGKHSKKQKVGLVMSKRIELEPTVGTPDVPITTETTTDEIDIQAITNEATTKKNDLKISPKDPITEGIVDFKDQQTSTSNYTKALISKNTPKASIEAAKAEINDAVSCIKENIDATTNQSIVTIKNALSIINAAIYTIEDDISIPSSLATGSTKNVKAPITPSEHEEANKISEAHADIEPPSAFPGTAEIHATNGITPKSVIIVDMEAPSTGPEDTPPVDTSKVQARVASIVKKLEQKSFRKVDGYYKRTSKKEKSAKDRSSEIYQIIIKHATNNQTGQLEPVPMQGLRYTAIVRGHTLDQLECCIHEYEYLNTWYMSDDGESLIIRSKKNKKGKRRN